LSCASDAHQPPIRIKAKRFPGHLPPEAREFFAHDRQWYLQQARAIGPACTHLIQQFLDDRNVERLTGVQSILRLAGNYGPERLEAA
jgi:hypothetical protein